MMKTLNLLIILTVAILGPCGILTAADDTAKPAEADKPAAAASEEKPAADTEAPAAEKQPDTTVYVTMNGKDLTAQDVDYMVKNRFAMNEAMAADRWIELKLKSAKARELGLTDTAEVKFVMDLVVDNYLAWLVEMHLHEQLARPDEEKAREVFDADPGKYDQPFRTTIQHITVSDRALASKLIAEAKSGGSFDKLVRTYSIADDKNRRGRLNMAAYSKLKNDFGPAVADAIKAADKDDILGPLLGARGFEVIKVVAVQKEGPRTFEDVKDQILFELQEQQDKDFRQNLIDELKAAATIIKTDALKALEAKQPAGPGR